MRYEWGVGSSFTTRGSSPGPTNRPDGCPWCPLVVPSVRAPSTPATRGTTQGHGPVDSWTRTGTGSFDIGIGTWGKTGGGVCGSVLRVHRPCVVCLTGVQLWSPPVVGPRVHETWQTDDTGTVPRPRPTSNQGWRTDTLETRSQRNRHFTPIVDGVSYEQSTVYPIINTS